MRSFQFLTLAIFTVYFLLTATGSILNLKKIFAKKIFGFLKIAFWLLHIGLLFGFMYLYVYPNQPREATTYPVYFYFNLMLFTVVLFNFPMALSLVLHSIFRGKGKSPVLPYAGFIISLGLAGGLVFGTIAGSRLIKVKQVEIRFPNLPRNFEDYRIVQLSDIHLGGLINPNALLEKTIKRTDKLDPDLLLVTGDMVNNFAYEIERVETALSNLTNNRPGYAILGNHDYGDYTNWENEAEKQANFDAIVKAHDKAGLKLLMNEHVVIKSGSDSLFLAGVENWGHSPFPQYADLDAALQGIPPEAFTLLMTHDPAHWEEEVAGKKNIALTLSGHTHGMQWGIKLAGIPFSLAYLTRKNWGGRYQSGNSILYVNTGLGTVGVPWRLDMPAEITLITLKRGEVD